MHKFFESIIIDTDSYKVSHFKQYPPETKTVYSYIESRSHNEEIVSMGIQSFIIDNLLEPITKSDVDFAEKLLSAHGLPFNRIGWMDIVGKHNGYLPLVIKAVKDGTVMPSNNVQVLVYNTDPNAFWLTSYIETALLRAVWYQSTVATISRNIKKIIKKYLDKTSENPEDQLPFKLHDFGSRGASSRETAMLGGMSHLVNFMGTDTIVGLIGAMKYYGNIKTPEKNMYGFSIPASEHSTMTSWTKDGEIDAMNNMIDKFSGDGKLYACVSDSYDFFNAVDNIWGKELRDKVIKSGGTLVIRPDSGDNVYNILYALESLSKSFGYSTNRKGYKVLHSSVRLIQGDGVNPKSLEEILSKMESDGWSADNVAFGMGGALLQSINRDTFKYAMKACAIQKKNGEFVPVSKNPITDPGKASKSGILHLFKNSDNTYKTKSDMIENNEDDLLVTQYYCGVHKNKSTFEEVRERAKII